MKEKSCSACKFIDRELLHNQAVCRRFPPVPVNDEARDKFYFPWPEVSKDDWCGEFELDTDDKDGAPL